MDPQRTPAVPDFINVPDDLTDVLAAVNTLIISMGETPVQTIDPPPTADVDKALAHLAFVDKAVQLAGYGWNTESDIILLIDGNGKVPVPSNLLALTSAYYPKGSPYQTHKVVRRNGFMYDATDHTPIFTIAPHIDAILRLPWVDLPESARQVITLRACQRFQAADQARQAVLQVNARDVQEAQIMLEREDAQGERYNILKGSRVAQARLGPQPRNNRWGV